MTHRRSGLRRDAEFVAPSGAEPIPPRPAALAGWLALLHPGPSVLVTACFVAAWGAATHRAPGSGEAFRLVALMLPIQFAIGVVNDLCDLDLDRLGSRVKPLVTGSVPTPVAIGLAGLLSLIGLGAAASFSVPTLGVALVGWGAGMAYDLGLKRTMISWIPWWIGFAALPLCAFAAAGRLDPRLFAAVPLTLGLALGLHLANALPDIEGDARSGSAGLGVRLGSGRSRRLSLALVSATGVGAVAMVPWLGQSPLPVVVGGGLTLLSTLIAGFRRLRRPFPVLAAASGLLAALWLLALP